MKHKNIFEQAITNMGYRKMNEGGNFYGKPVGFGIIICEIKENDVEFHTLTHFESIGDQLWNKSTMSISETVGDKEGEDAYKSLVYRIAYCEFECGGDRMFMLNSEKTFDFREIW